MGYRLTHLFRSFVSNWNKSSKERQIQHNITYMGNLKQKQTKQAHEYREEIDSCQWHGFGKVGKIGGQKL